MATYPKTSLNKVQRGAKRASYDIETVNQILDADFMGYVGYAYKGRAISLPMAYGRENNKIYLHGSLKNRMLLTLLEAEDISMTVMHLNGLVLARSGLHHSVNYRSATLFGKLKKVTDSLEKEKGLKCVIDQMIPGRWENLRPILEKELNGTLVAEMVIETASAKIRDVGVHDEKSDMELPIWAGIVPIKQLAETPQSDPYLPEGVAIPEHIDNYVNKNSK
ncbi:MULTISPECIES: pyridoxamine 5'-phosphate oxidase family protein [Galbibacter]|uniref:Pyridoxamine 5'-phosphate oxidase family protein n=1 Tax=Galbibacter pacificus TaxID=2996052 RepID=A0ABT6FPT3_9FLAO|nr:pyridoxamine 5'-phosphate oxidase family protein [Galbibacter pacificus]MDG3581633.1 pyridoxamine 5'-phosphate oxidase family protein [Galbibacter pacificus]MDG3585111.1 pyridoxamine 5'-phosphate oxidase family protein [Galbibacter pacificus]